MKAQASSTPGYGEDASDLDTAMRSHFLNGR